MGAAGIQNLGLTTVSGILALRPEVNIDEIKKQLVPDQVHIGVVFGYSLPIYVADSHEELFFRQAVPYRWDGASDIVMHLKVALGAAEDVGDSFRLQISWEHLVAAQPIPATMHNVEVEWAVLVGRNAQYDEYGIEMILDYDIDGAGNEVQHHELLGIRLRRLDATNPDITGEVLILDWHLHYQVDKIFQGSIV